MEMITIHNNIKDSYEPIIYEGNKEYTVEEYLVKRRRITNVKFILQLTIFILIMIVRALIFIKYNV